MQALHWHLAIIQNICRHLIALPVTQNSELLVWMQVRWAQQIIHACFDVASQWKLTRLISWTFAPTSPAVISKATLPVTSIDSQQFQYLLAVDNSLFPFMTWGDLTCWHQRRMSICIFNSSFEKNQTLWSGRLRLETILMEKLIKAPGTHCFAGCHLKVEGKLLVLWCLRARTDIWLKYR